MHSFGQKEKESERGIRAKVISDGDCERRQGIEVVKNEKNHINSSVSVGHENT